jgi:hypothetical protein
MVTKANILRPPPGTAGRRSRAREQGALMADLVVALGILVLAALPIAFAFDQERRLCRMRYQEAVAMEIVDGEMEVLAAGEWRAFPEGQSAYAVKAGAAKNLPPGGFNLTRKEQTLRLEWKPARKGGGRPIVREVRLP